MRRSLDYLVVVGSRLDLLAWTDLPELFEEDRCLVVVDYCSGKAVGNLQVDLE